MPESAKEGDSVLPEGSDIGLGPSGRGFEPLHSDQKLSEISDFRELFLFLVYCGARGEVAASGIFFLSSAICKPPFVVDKVQ